MRTYRREVQGAHGECRAPHGGGGGGGDVPGGAQGAAGHGRRGGRADDGVEGEVDECHGESVQLAMPVWAASEGIQVSFYSEWGLAVYKAVWFPMPGGWAWRAPAYRCRCWTKVRRQYQGRRDRCLRDGSGPAPARGLAAPAGRADAPSPRRPPARCRRRRVPSRTSVAATRARGHRSGSPAPTASRRARLRPRSSGPRPPVRCGAARRWRTWASLSICECGCRA